MSRRDERGVVLVIVALLTTAILIVAALVLDMSLVRQNRQETKSAADHAAAAGIRGLENTAGVPQPWRGVCMAIEYLMANDTEFADLSGTYANGDGSVTHATNPCGAPGTAPYTTLCNPSSLATWATFTGTSAGGRIAVTIRSGYRLPDAAFAEDTTAGYAGDTGNPALGGCDQLAVVVRETEPAMFGRIAGPESYASTVRSVARLEVGNVGDATAALLLLERTDCRVLAISGTSGARVRVAGFGSSPGIIHADSLGNGVGCNAGDPQNGKVFQVDGNPGDPRIVAERAASPIGSEAAGIISTVAMSDRPGAVSANASSPWPVEVCAQQLATHCQTTSPVIGVGPTGGPLVGRGPLDLRYRRPILELRDRAATRFSWSAASPPPAGWTTVACDAPGPFTAARIWVDCAGGPFSGNGKTFEASVEEVVINGSVVVDGNGSLLHLVSPAAVYVRGSSTGDAVTLVGTDNRILVNDGGATDADGDGFACDERFAASPSARATFVVGRGPIRAEGGSGKVLRLCQTTVFMMDDSGSPGCPIPATDGVAPYDNACRGHVRVAGSNRLDWSAPNVNDVTTPTRAELDRFEDLAYWSETQGPGACSASAGSCIEGTGGIRLSGIFSVPNADPFRVGGNGGYDITEAQFVTRRLEVAGNGTLLMHPQPENALQVPIFGGFSLVR